MVWRKIEKHLRTTFGHRASRFIGEPRWVSDAEACCGQPVNNYMYCDIHGEYGYRLRGKIPIRSNDAGSCNPHDHFSNDSERRFCLVPLMILQGNRLPVDRNRSYDLPRNHV